MVSYAVYPGSIPGVATKRNEVIMHTIEIVSEETGEHFCDVELSDADYEHIVEASKTEGVTFEEYFKNAIVEGLQTVAGRRRIVTTRIG